MNRLPQLKARDLIRALKALGFVFVRQKGSHAFYRNSYTGRTTVVTIHGSQDIDRSLLMAIIREIGIDVEKFLKALGNKNE